VVYASGSQTFLSVEHYKVILSGQGTPSELPSNHKLFFSPKLPLLRFRTVNEIMHNKSNHKA